MNFKLSLALSAFCMLIGLSSCDKQQTKQENKVVTDKEATATPPKDIFFYNATWNMINPIIAPLGEARGLEPAVAITCVSLTGLFNAAGRFPRGSLSDKLGRVNTVILLCVVTIACALLLIFVGGPAYIVVVLVTAFAFGGPSAVNPATSTDIFGAKYSGTNYGVIMLSLGVSSIVFNAISNALVKSTGAYTMTFIMGAVTALITIGLMLVVGHYVKKGQQKQG